MILSSKVVQRVEYIAVGIQETSRLLIPVLVRSTACTVQWIISNRGTHKGMGAGHLLTIRYKTILVALFINFSDQIRPRVLRAKFARFLIPFFFPGRLDQNLHIESPWWNSLICHVVSFLTCLCSSMLKRAIFECASFSEWRHVYIYMSLKTYRFHDRSCNWICIHCTPRFNFLAYIDKFKRNKFCRGMHRGEICKLKRRPGRAVFHSPS